MTSLSRRIAFLTGASISALGVAFPADAATVPGISDNPTALPGNVVDTLIISNIGDNLDFGVDNSGAGLITSTVNSVPTGEIQYIATATGVPPASGNVDMSAANNGDVTVAAIATATGLASAFAAVSTGVFEQGNAVGDALVDLTNTNSLSVQAVANAIAAVGTFAIADAQVNAGVSQVALAGSSAAITLSNGTAAILNVDAIAAGTGSSAFVDANVINGVAQVALGGSAASVGIDNDGTIDIDAIATAVGTSGGAFATGTVQVGVDQQALSAGPAAVSLTNDGTLGVNAAADASAAVVGSAVANALVQTGIEQDATGVTASVSVANVGTINIGAAASADAASGLASASAIVSEGVNQAADGSRSRALPG